MEYIKFADDQYFCLHRNTQPDEEAELFCPTHYHNLFEIYFITGPKQKDYRNKG